MEIKSKEISLFDINFLCEYPKNINKHPPMQIERLVKIIESQGFRDPLVADRKPNDKGMHEVIAGNGRLMAAKKIGVSLVPVIFQDFVDEEEKYKFMVSHNAIAEWSEIDMAQLNKDIEELGPFDIDLLGIEDFVVEIAEKFEPQSDEDEFPELKPDPVTKKGDIWLLGNHRVMCGDSTMIDDVEKLMVGNYPDLIHTDPPYGMNAVSKSSVLKERYGKDIHGDDSPEIAKSAFSLIYGLYPNAKQIWWGANYYCSALPDSECWLVWDKNNGQSDQTDCELAWANFRSVVRKFTQSSEKTNRVHPTQKPVSLTEWIIKRFKLSSNTIADFFGGSGSTVIAAEKNNLSCFCMEYDEAFLDVIINRWQKYTGKKAVLESNGQTYDSLKESRDANS